MSQRRSRRSVLAAVAAVALGGCVGGGDGGDDTPSGDGTPTPGGEPTVTPEQTPTPGGEPTATPEQTPTPGGEPTATPEQTPTPTAESPEEMVERLPEPSPLASSLVDLVLATDRATMANDRGFQFESGTVRVDISLVDGGDPPERYLPDDRTEYGQTVIAYVDIDSLVDLALHDAVQFVAPYLEPKPDRR